MVTNTPDQSQEQSTAKDDEALRQSTAKDDEERQNRTAKDDESRQQQETASQDKPQQQQEAASQDKSQQQASEQEAEHERARAAIARQLQEEKDAVLRKLQSLENDETSPVQEVQQKGDGVEYSEDGSKVLQVGGEKNGTWSRVEESSAMKDWDASAKIEDSTITTTFTDGKDSENVMTIRQNAESRDRELDLSKFKGAGEDVSIDLKYKDGTQIAVDIDKDGNVSIDKERSHGDMGKLTVIGKDGKKMEIDQDKNLVPAKDQSQEAAQGQGSGQESSQAADQEKASTQAEKKSTIELDDGEAVEAQKVTEKSAEKSTSEPAKDAASTGKKSAESSVEPEKNGQEKQMSERERFQAETKESMQPKPGSVGEALEKGKEEGKQNWQKDAQKPKGEQSVSQAVEQDIARNTTPKAEKDGQEAGKTEKANPAEKEAGVIDTETTLQQALKERDSGKQGQEKPAPEKVEIDTKTSLQQALKERDAEKNSASVEGNKAADKGDAAVKDQPSVPVKESQSSVIDTNTNLKQALEERAGKEGQSKEASAAAQKEVAAALRDLKNAGVSVGGAAKNMPAGQQPGGREGGVTR